MIEKDAHLKAAQEAMRNLQQVLLAARKVHRGQETEIVWGRSSYTSLIEQRLDLLICERILACP
jgi:hypothetical protein